MSDALNQESEPQGTNGKKNGNKKKKKKLKDVSVSVVLQHHLGQGGEGISGGSSSEFGEKLGTGPAGLSALPAWLDAFLKRAKKNSSSKNCNIDNGNAFAAEFAESLRQRDELFNSQSHSQSSTAKRMRRGSKRMRRRRRQGLKTDDDDGGDDDNDGRGSLPLPPLSSLSFAELEDEVELGVDTN